MGLLGNIIKAVVTKSVTKSVTHVATVGFVAAASAASEKTNRKKIETDARIQELLITEKITRITMPHGFRYYKGKNYIEVEKELKAYGFENITCVTYKSSIFKSNNIYRISIGGKSEFNKKDVFYSNEKVLIIYYR